MGFWEDLGNGLSDFFLGSDAGTKAQENLSNQIQNTLLNQNNYMQDFKTNAGTAINNLANRGIINSSTASSALSNAANQAQQNYINNQLRAYGLLSGLIPQDTTGLLPSVASAFAGGLGTGLGKSIFGA